jgi:hypothetical protein
MTELTDQTIPRSELKVKIHSVMSKLAPEHGIGLKEHEYKKYIDQLLADEFKGRDDASLEEIAAVLQLPFFFASVSKDGMKRLEIWYASAFSRVKNLETEFIKFKEGFEGKHSSLDEISLYLLFFQKKGLMEDYDRWLEENWRVGSSDSAETSDFWLSSMFIMRYGIGQRMGKLGILSQNKKAISKPLSSKQKI